MSKSTSYTIDFTVPLVSLTVALLIIKLCFNHALTWLEVFMPLWVPIALFLLWFAIITVIFIYHYRQDHVIKTQTFSMRIGKRKWKWEA